jgi:flagellar motility protein MotE (MotC chaperone)
MTSKTVRLLPALIATLAVVLALRAAAVAEEATSGATAPEGAAAPPAAPEGAASGAAASTPNPTEGAAQACVAGPSFAEQAGLSQSEVRVLQTLGDRRKALEAREAELGQQGQLMEAAQKRLDERVGELKKLEASIQVLLGQLDEAQEKRIVELVGVYQRMRPKDAAAVFDGLEEDVLLQVASRMKQQNLAEIMGKMRPDRARALTKAMAEQRKPPESVTGLPQRQS